MAAAEECKELHSASVFSPAQTVNQDLCLVYKASLEEKKKVSLPALAKVQMTSELSIFNRICHTDESAICIKVSYFGMCSFFSPSVFPNIYLGNSLILFAKG